jgi:hypothetical protein
MQLIKSSLALKERRLQNDDEDEDNAIRIIF